MGWPLVRFKRRDSAIAWGCLRGEDLFSLASSADTLAGLLREDVAGLARSALVREASSLASVEVLSPATAPCQIICQGKNYLDHLLETGVKPQNKDFNLLFTKADSSLASPSGVLRRPAGVRLLDYEVELGLVIGRGISEPVRVGDAELASYVAGLVLCNDVSARDVQVPERQWFRGKSFRGFCPVGPVFYFMEPADWAHLYSLELELRVNGAVRQKASTAQMMHRPPETLELISRTFDLRAGDLILTGTPGGVSMRVAGKTYEQEVADLRLSDKEKFARFVEEQFASGRYLKSGDLIEASIRSADGAIDLGAQSLVVQE
jgi:2-keto-4-pentenoate hydratase/2-oxohepta-3-ene-1,7-dioic acid hydratase in catechol pathway